MYEYRVCTEYSIQYQCSAVYPEYDVQSKYRVWIVSQYDRDG